MVQVEFKVISFGEIIEANMVRRLIVVFRHVHVSTSFCKLVGVMWVNKLSLFLLLLLELKIVTKCFPITSLLRVAIEKTLSKTE